MKNILHTVKHFRAYMLPAILLLFLSGCTSGIQEYRIEESTPVIEYYKNGNKLSEGVLKDGMEEGEWIYYHENGVKMSEGVLKAGREEGVWISYYGNEMKMSEGVLKDGKKEGAWIFYHENGNKKSEGVYKDDREEGMWISYHENGTKMSEGLFKNGMEEEWTGYGENGSKIVEFNEDEVSEFLRRRIVRFISDIYCGMGNALQALYSEEASEEELIAMGDAFTPVMERIMEEADFKDEEDLSAALSQVQDWDIIRQEVTIFTSFNCPELPDELLEEMITEFEQKAMPS